ncbi:MAG TPA: hypothetical protein VK031_04730 [Tissierellaceae bacterium]|nr:hypothetical protein [Tissierellaceae bacterium]
MGWDYSKLPEDKLSYVQQLVQDNNVGALLKVHNNYKLSRYTYCCGTKGILLHFKRLLDERIGGEGKDNK